MLDWLREKKQTSRAISRFWQQVLVSAVNEDLDKMAATHGLQVFYLGFLAKADSYEMGIPSVPLADLYSEESWLHYPNVKIRHGSAVRQLCIEQDCLKGVMLHDGSLITADAYILAVPFERVQSLVPDFEVDLSAFTHSPITGIHLWFDRPITGFAPCNTTRSNHSMDVQQERRQTYSTGRERLS